MSSRKSIGHKKAQKSQTIGVSFEVVGAQFIAPDSRNTDGRNELRPYIGNLDLCPLCIFVAILFLARVTESFAKRLGGR
jgi:hypothetical protein